MKLLHRVENETGSIELWRHSDGNYYFDCEKKDGYLMVMLPSAHADQFRVATLPGFEPTMDAEAIAAAKEPPHPDD